MNSILKQKKATKLIAIYAIILASMISLVWISIPIFTVVFTLQVLFICLAGLLLGPIHGFLCTSIYLFMGAIGLPVFAGYSGGVFFLINNYTSGFLWGFPFLAFFTGMGAKLGEKHGFVLEVTTIFTFIVIGQIVLYILNYTFS